MCVCVCRDLLKNKKTSITNFTQEKSHLPKCPAFFIHLNIILDCISLCLETYIHILGFSLAYTLILIKKTDLYDLNFVENEEWFEISR